MLTRRTCLRLRLPGRLYTASRLSSQLAQLQRAPSEDIPAFLRGNAGPVYRPPQTVQFQTKLTEEQISEHLSFINVCLHNGHDIPRAKHIFERLQKELSGHEKVNSRLYNRMIESYMDMALLKDAGLWVEDAYFLYCDMEEGGLVPAPTASTYGLMLLAWVRHSQNTKDPMDFFDDSTPKTLLERIKSREIPITEVVSDRVFHSSEEALVILRALAKVAADTNGTLKDTYPEIVQALAAGQTVSSSTEAIPVTKPRLLTDEEKAEGQIGTTHVMDVPFNLSNLRQHLDTVALGRHLLPNDLMSRQRMLEDSVTHTAQARSDHEVEALKRMGIDKEMDEKRVASQLKENLATWVPLVAARIRTSVDALKILRRKGQQKPGVEDLSPFLAAVKPETLAHIVLAEMLNEQRLSSTGFDDCIPAPRAMIAVGKAVEAEFSMEMERKNGRVARHAYNLGPGTDGSFSQGGTMKIRLRQGIARKSQDDTEAYRASWTNDRRIQIGGMLLKYLVSECKITARQVNPETERVEYEEQEAFYHRYMMVQGKRHGVIAFNNELLRLMETSAPPLSPRHLPMLVPPRQWTGYKNGGYLQHKTPVMRCKDSKEQRGLVKQESDRGRLALVYNALDILGSTPWKINWGIFDVVLEVWNSGEKLGKIPAAKYPDPMPTVEDEAPYTDDPALQERRAYRKLRAWKVASSNNHTDRCAVNYKLEIARTFLDDTFYFPHNVDFRGRAYPVPPHLNHIGNDLSRGMLMFAEGKPLQVQGLRWLKIHLSNLYGYDKANFVDREQFTVDNLAEIYDSAENPITGRGWWKSAGDPWQCLAACMELRNALEAPDPTQYVSFLPVHQDGTCNGLQHYAALGKDARGAAQVNLTATEKPSDVYTFVANMVEEAILVDVRAGNKYAVALTGKISRKVVKQTVMTTVYGVTFIGARAQIEKQLTERGDIPIELVWGASSYLATQVIACIGNLFTSASSIQEWLSICARIISKAIPGQRLSDVLDSSNERLKQKKQKLMQKFKPVDVPAALELRLASQASVVWATPMGLPIVQPYRKGVAKTIKTALQVVQTMVVKANGEVKGQKQATAFPPNYIHSLDATHMMLTAIECSNNGIMFASVHDSYWTHACDIEQMSGHIRDCFIRLHEGDLLKILRDQFVEYYQDHWVPALHLASPSLCKTLRGAGVRLNVTLETAQTLNGIQSLLVVGEGEETPMMEVKDPKLIAELERSAGKVFSGEKGAEDEDLEESDEESEEKEGEETDIKVLMTSKELAKNFIPLASLLPPMPERGDFDIAEIRKSPYFFS